MNRLSKGVVIESFEQLEQGLKEWSSFGDPDAYDVGGMMTLFCACVDNLRKYALPGEIEDRGADLSDEEREFLKALIGPK